MTKKNRTLIITFSILSIVVLIVLLSSTVFTVNSITVNWQTERNELSSITQENIVEDSGIRCGTNVFFVSKNQAISQLEKKYPYIKIVNIETRFPNKIVIHAREREQTFAIQQTDKYILVDSDFKILDVVNGDFESTNENAIKILSTQTFSEQSGDFIEIIDGLQSLSTLQTSFYQNGKELNNMTTLFKNVTYSETKLVFNTFLGVKVEIYRPTYKQQEKIAMLYEQLGRLSTEQRLTGTIIIGDRDGKVQGSYTENV